MPDSRVEAAARALYRAENPRNFPWHQRSDAVQAPWRFLAVEILAAADEAEPRVPVSAYNGANAAAERAEAAARDFAKALRQMQQRDIEMVPIHSARTLSNMAAKALREHPEYSEESGT